MLAFAGPFVINIFSLQGALKKYPHPYILADLQLKL